MYTEFLLLATDKRLVNDLTAVVLDQMTFTDYRIGYNTKLNLDLYMTTSRGALSKD